MRGTLSEILESALKLKVEEVIIISISIRTVKVQDSHDLSELFQDFIKRDSNILSMQSNIEIILKNPHYHVAVACDEDKVIGTAMGILCYDLVGECNPFMVVENVVVSPVYQGKGIGKSLMKSIEEFGLMNGASYVILVSGSKRTDSHKFYESLGYTADQRGFKKRLKKQ